MTEAAKTSILEHLRPSKHLKEAVAADVMYIPGKTAIQFYGEVEKEQAKRLKEATEALEQAKQDRPEMLAVITELLPHLDPDLRTAIAQLDLAIKYLGYAQTICGHEKYIENLRSCKAYEENHTGKFGLDAKGRRFNESDILLAATMSDNNDR